MSEANRHQSRAATLVRLRPIPHRPQLAQSARIMLAAVHGLPLENVNPRSRPRRCFDGRRVDLRVLRRRRPSRSRGRLRASHLRRLRRLLRFGREALLLRERRRRMDLARRPRVSPPGVALASLRARVSALVPSLRLQIPVLSRPSLTRHCRSPWFLRGAPQHGARRLLPATESGRIWPLRRAHPRAAFRCRPSDPCRDEKAPARTGRAQR